VSIISKGHSRDYDLASYLPRGESMSVRQGCRVARTA